MDALYEQIEIALRHACVAILGDDEPHHHHAALLLRLAAAGARRRDMDRVRLLMDLQLEVGLPSEPTQMVMLTGPEAQAVLAIQAISDIVEGANPDALAIRVMGVAEYVMCCLISRQYDLLSKVAERVLTRLNIPLQSFHDSMRQAQSGLDN